jgi:hypothetical protein
MTRDLLAVMRDLAAIHGAEGPYTAIHRDEWAGLIRELADLSDDEYAAALESHRTIAQIATVAARLVDAKP